MSQRQNFIQTEVQPNTPRGIIKSTGGSLNNTQKMQSMHQSIASSMVKGRDSVLGEEKPTQKFRANGPKTSRQMKQPGVISLNLTGVAKKHTKAKEIQDSLVAANQLITELKGSLYHEHSKELSQEIQHQINELNQIYHSLSQQNLN